MPKKTGKAGAEFRLRATEHPIVFEVNARVLLHMLSVKAGKRMTLGTIPDALLNQWASLGVDAVWMMGVWSAGPEGIRQAREHPALREEYRKALPDVTDDDIVGSPYAVKDYVVSDVLGGRRSLAALRKRLRERGMGLILDFVPNHTARDHPWVTEHPEYYVHGKAENAARWPETWFTAAVRGGGEVAVAYGKDPYFPGWTDTAQIEYRSPAARKAVIRALEDVASLCDGVRCDMAMLMLEEVFAATWDTVAPYEGERATGEFWADAVAAVKKRHPAFLFVAEAYWGKEWELQQLGFDHTYDKVLYDRLLHEGAGAVYEHMKADFPYQSRLVRFIENHDEPRAASRMPSVPWHSAAAAVALAAPGMVLLHDGQIDGRSVKLPVQLRRLPDEEPVLPLRSFYERFLAELSSPVIRRGMWSLLHAGAAWAENPSWNNIIAYWWQHEDAGMRLVVVNYAPHNSQCYVRLPLDGHEEHSFEFRDRMSDAVYVREKSGLTAKGMYFDLQPYGIHLFVVTPLPR